jgi:sporulation protein YlmC with PRC-barrel domain
MSASRGEEVVYLQALLTRDVVDRDGRRLGRVWEVMAEREGDALCISAVVVGVDAWPGRFGSKRGTSGTVIPWEEIDVLSPRIVVRRSEQG